MTEKQVALWINPNIDILVAHPLPAGK